MSCEVFSSELRHGSRSLSFSRETSVDSDSLLTKSWKESRERSRSEPIFHRSNVTPLDMPPSQLRNARLLQSLEVLSDGAEEAEQPNSPMMKESIWNASACLEAVSFFLASATINDLARISELTHLFISIFNLAVHLEYSTSYLCPISFL